MGLVHYLSYAQGFQSITEISDTKVIDAVKPRSLIGSLTHLCFFALKKWMFIHISICFNGERDVIVHMVRVVVVAVVGRKEKTERST